MVRYDETEITKVRDASDLVSIVGDYVSLKKRGRDFWCCCPFHHEKTPSCKIDSASQLWHCFGCGEGGDVFGFVMKIQDISFPDALRFLAERAHIELSVSANSDSSHSQKARLREVCAETARFYHTQLMRLKSSDADAARAYLSSRNLGSSIPRNWQLGFAPGRGKLVAHLSSMGFTQTELIEANVAVKREGKKLSDRFFKRIMFPIFDAAGDCIAFGGRVIGAGEPKYLNSQETPLFHKSRVLYGLNAAKAEITASGDVLIVEGYTDVISLHEHGIKNAVATLGTALTLQHIRLLSRYAPKRIIYLFDGDAAGQRACDRALNFINADMTPEAGKTQVELCAITLPDDFDPADFVEERGADALRELLQHAKALIQFGIDRRLALHNTQTPEGRTQAFNDALSVLAPIKTSLLAKDYAIQIAGRLQIREEDALARLASLKVPASYRNEDEVAARQASFSYANSQAHSPQDTTRLKQDALPVKQSSAEKSRCRMERKFLVYLAQNPNYALDYASSLASLEWHDSQHAAIASVFLRILEDKPTLSSAELISVISREIPSASGFLTLSLAHTSSNIKEEIRFIAEELEIGDLEQNISSMNTQLKHEEELTSDDRDFIFRSLVDMQKMLGHKRANHNPVLP